MKIAKNIPLSALTISTARLALLIGLGFVSLPVTGFAQDAVGSTTGSPGVAAPISSTLPEASSVGTSAGIMASGPAPAGTLALPLPPAKSSGQSVEKMVAAMGDKAIDNAKSAIKTLESATDETSLADLNRAKQAMSRIDAMIDLEKRLGELDKLRSDRVSASMPPLLPGGFIEGALPASALMPPGGPMGAGGDAPKTTAVSSARPDVSQIFGTGGSYMAVLKFPGGETKTVKVGDRVSKGETVRAITSSTVEVAGKGKSYTLRVKNVDLVYSVVR